MKTIFIILLNVFFVIAVCVLMLLFLCVFGVSTAIIGCILFAILAGLVLPKLLQQKNNIDG